ncbi:putative serine protease F56F10.1 isoform X2 [Plodia interpunctella]|uniref:putative serine protease F56F10.1 isoform X2 n=1 Tax=Plodia interpunctella TaxID=58824 RepID=UPI002368DE0D|nr:putative serine protease F56F10.1 isoform X2 [Plodia interpunctella]
MWPLLLPALFAGALGLRTLEPPPPVSTTRNTYEERWLDVRLDHFSAFYNDTFPMRFYYNGEFAVNNQVNNHIVIFVGGEWAISPGWVTGGLAHEFAGYIQAGVFYTEHRYYGLTRPTNDTEVSNLRYLTVDQALADLAQFIEYIKSDEFENGLYREGKVVLVGCSYAGSMATWMRLAYPHLTDAVLSDSGPLHAQTDFVEYLEKINSVLLEQGGQTCVNSIQEAVNEIVPLLSTQTGVTTISDVFNTCSPQTTNPMDSSTFFWFGITETLAYLVQYAMPGHITDACSVLTNSSESSAMRRLANYVNAHPWSQPCIRNSYSDVVAGHTNTSFDSSDSVMRLWTYQSCVEFGWFQTTNGNLHVFANAIPLEYFHQMCQDFFSLYFNSNLTESGVARTNLLFAGLSHLPDYTISVAGGADPWAPMGPTGTHESALAPVFVVPGVSHCRAIQSTENSESTELHEVKWEVMNILSEYVTGTRMSAANGVFASLALILCAVAIAA